MTTTIKERRKAEKESKQTKIRNSEKIEPIKNNECSLQFKSKTHKIIQRIMSSLFSSYSLSVLSHYFLHIYS